eukprot:5532595-Alexandrium_andersonii.AAC.1
MESWVRAAERAVWPIGRVGAAASRSGFGATPLFLGRGSGDCASGSATWTTALGQQRIKPL